MLQDKDGNEVFFDIFVQLRLALVDGTRSVVYKKWIK